MIQPIILIQARLGSARFPEKVNAFIDDRTMLEIVSDRAEATGLDWRVAWAEDWPWVPEEDVLGRFWRVLMWIDGAERYDPIIRLTADCPLLDAGQILNVLTQYRLSPQADLVSTCPAWDGLDVEVISRAALARAHAAATERYDREHVSPWIKRNGTWREIPLDTTLRWSVDDPDGLEFVRKVFEACEHCRAGVPRHTNSASSIGGADRAPRWDLHHLDRGDLAECTAFDLLKTRMGGPIYVSP